MIQRNKSGDIVFVSGETPPDVIFADPSDAAQAINVFYTGFQFARQPVLGLDDNPRCCECGLGVSPIFMRLPVFIIGLGEPSVLQWACPIRRWCEICAALAEQGEARKLQQIKYESRRDRFEAAVSAEVKKQRAESAVKAEARRRIVQKRGQEDEIY